MKAPGCQVLLPSPCQGWLEWLGVQLPWELGYFVREVTRREEGVCSTLYVLPTAEYLHFYQGLKKKIAPSFTFQISAALSLLLSQLCEAFGEGLLDQADGVTSDCAEILIPRLTPENSSDRSHPRAASLPSWFLTAASSSGFRKGAMEIRAAWSDLSLRCIMALIYSVTVTVKLSLLFM